MNNKSQTGLDKLVDNVTDKLVDNVTDNSEEDDKPWYVTNPSNGAPWKGDVDDDKKEKPCRFCGCISPKNEDHALAGESELWTCPNCGYSFHAGWNEQAPYRNFLKGVGIDGWRQ